MCCSFDDAAGGAIVSFHTGGCRFWAWALWPRGYVLVLACLVGVLGVWELAGAETCAMEINDPYATNTMTGSYATANDARNGFSVPGWSAGYSSGACGSTILCSGGGLGWLSVYWNQGGNENGGWRSQRWLYCSSCPTGQHASPQGCACDNGAPAGTSCTCPISAPVEINGVCGNCEGETVPVGGTCQGCPANGHKVENHCDCDDGFLKDLFGACIPKCERPDDGPWNTYTQACCAPDEEVVGGDCTKCPAGASWVDDPDHPGQKKCLAGVCPGNMPRDLVTGECTMCEFPDQVFSGNDDGTCIFPPCPDGKVRQGVAPYACGDDCHQWQTWDVGEQRCKPKACDKPECARDIVTGECCGDCPLTGQVRHPVTGECYFGPCEGGNQRDPVTHLCGGADGCAEGMTRKDSSSECAPDKDGDKVPDEQDTDQDGDGTPNDSDPDATEPCSDPKQTRDKETGKCSVNECTEGFERDEDGNCNPKNGERNGGGPGGTDEDPNSDAPCSEVGMERGAVSKICEWGPCPNPSEQRDANHICRASAKKEAEKEAGGELDFPGLMRDIKGKITDSPFGRSLAPLSDLHIAKCCNALSLPFGNKNVSTTYHCELWGNAEITGPVSTAMWLFWSFLSVMIILGIRLP